MVGRLTRALLVFSLALAAAGCADCTSSGGSADGPLGDVGLDAPHEPDTSLRDAGDLDSSAPDAPPVDAPPADAPDASAEPDTACSADCDYDGLSDCEEAHFGTDPCNHDTDQDGLTDYEEAFGPSDPLLADSDQDGVDDAEELAVGLDPARQSSLDDGVDDAARWIASACESPQAEAMLIHSSASGLFRIGLPPGFSHFDDLNISAPSGSEAAAVFSDPANEVAGFVFSRELSAAQQPPEQLNADLTSSLSQVGAVAQDFQASAFLTHHGQQAARSEFLIQAPSTLAPRAFRDQVLFAFSSLSAQQVSNLPAHAGAGYQDYRLFFSTVIQQRPGRPTRAITTAAVAPQQKYSRRESTRFRIADATDTTNLSFPSDATETRCLTQAAKDKQKVDFYWVLDYGVNMTHRLNDIARLATRIVPRLEQSSLDFRLGVTSMGRTQEGRLNNPPGWHTDAQSFEQQFDHDDPLADQNPPAIVFPFESTYKGIRYMKGLDGDSPAAGERIRSDAQLVTIFASNTEPHETVVPSYALHPIEVYLSFLEAHTTAFALIPDQTPACRRTDDYHDWTAYTESARRTGGAVASICVEDVEETVGQILAQAQGDTSPYVLADTPISSTLRVFVNGQWVPRSRQNGFDYSPEHNSLTFYGTYRPFLHSDQRQVHSLSVHYERWSHYIK